MSDKFEVIKEFATEQMAENKCAAHNIEHVLRVYKLAMKLAGGENVDMDVIEAASLLHDIGGVRESADPTGQTDHAVESAKIAEPFLREIGFSEDKIAHIKNCILSHRYRTENKPETLEAKIVFDADKLETAGAIGIARSFVWVGRHNARIYRKVNLDEYAKENLGGKINGRIQDKTKHSPQINWETKDKFILDYLYTDKAKAMAAGRKKFYEEFLERLEREINGEL
jgi:uncharacterized protein